MNFEKMNTSKIIQTIDKFYTNINKSNPDNLSDEENFFIHHVEFELAQSIIRELGETTAKKMANIILADADV